MRHRKERVEHGAFAVGSALMQCLWFRMHIKITKQNRRTYASTYNPNTICCDVIGCGYEAVRKADFDKHMWVHMLELYTADMKKQYRYQAFGCDYRTLSKSDFQKHFMFHLRAKPYQCMVPGCGYASWPTVLLDTHMKVHISPKPTSTSV